MRKACNNSYYIIIYIRTVRSNSVLGGLAASVMFTVRRQKIKTPPLILLYSEETPLLVAGGRLTGRAWPCRPPPLSQNRRESQPTEGGRGHAGRQAGGRSCQGGGRRSPFNLQYFLVVFPQKRGCSSQRFTRCIPHDRPLTVSLIATAASFLPKLTLESILPELFTKKKGMSG